MFGLDPGIIVSAVLFVVLAVLLYLRRRSNTTVSFRLLGRVMVNNGHPKICPHLGQFDDPFVHQDRPSGDHRCYLWMQRDRIDMSHQKGFCLSVAHQHCPWLAIGNGSGSARPARLGLGMVGSGIGAVAAAVSSGGGHATARAVPAARAGATGFGLLARVLFFEARTWSLRIVVHLRAWSVIAIIWVTPHLRSTGVAARAELIALSRRAWTALRASLSRDAATGSDVQAASTSEPSSAGAKESGAETTASPNVQRLLQEGRSAGMTGNRRVAYACFALAVEMDPRSDEAWLWKAAMTDNEKERQQCLQTALALNPANARARGGARQITKSAQDAAPDAQAVLSEAVPAPVPTVKKARRGKSATASAEMDVLDQGLAALERGEEEQAYQLFKRATDLNPGSEKAWFWRAKTATSLAELISCLEHAQAINPDNEKVKSNLAWAMERMEREQRRRRYAQPLAQVPAPIAGGSHAATAAHAYQARISAPVSDQRSQDGKLRWIAGISAMLLACYWLWGALVPFTGVPPVPGAGILGVFLPTFSLAGTTWYASFELLPGYNLLEMVPYAVGFLFVFVARGLCARERWALLWGVLLAAVTLVTVLRLVSNPAAVIVAAMLCMALAGGILVGKREFVP